MSRLICSFVAGLLLSSASMPALSQPVEGPKPRADVDFTATFDKATGEFTFEAKIVAKDGAWFSSALPPSLKVSFCDQRATSCGSSTGVVTSATTAHASFTTKICQGDGRAVCAEVGLTSFRAGEKTSYKEVIEAYAEVKPKR